MIRPGLIDMRAQSLNPAPTSRVLPGWLQLNVPTPARVRGALRGRGLWNVGGRAAQYAPRPVFIYHGVCETGSAPAGCSYTLEQRVFTAHLDEIRRFGAATLRLDDPAEFACGGEGVALTFDDGCGSWSRRVAPAMAERNIKAAFFVIANPAFRRTGSRASGATLTWRDLRTIAEIRGADGEPLFAIGSHTHRHVDLSALMRCAGPHAVLEELRQSRQTIEEGIGRSCRILSLPGGRTDGDETTRRALLWVIREAGFEVIRDSTPRYDRDPRTDLLGGSPVYAHTTAAMIRFELSRMRRWNWLNAARWTWLRATGRWREVADAPAPIDSARVGAGVSTIATGLTSVRERT